MRRAFLFVMFLVGILIGMTVAWAAQEAKDPKPPVITPESKAAILEIQLRLLQAQNEFAQLQARIRTLQDSFQSDSLALQAAQKEACKAAKADCDKDWSLNLQTLKFEAKPKAAPEPPKKP